MSDFLLKFGTVTKLIEDVSEFEMKLKAAEESFAPWRKRRLWKANRGLLVHKISNYSSFNASIMQSSLVFRRLDRRQVPRRSPFPLADDLQRQVRELQAEAGHQAQSPEREAQEEEGQVGEERREICGEHHLRKISLFASAITDGLACTPGSTRATATTTSPRWGPSPTTPPRPPPGPRFQTWTSSASL